MPPSEPELSAFLARYAPFSEVPLCPGLFAFTARSLVEVWAAAEQLAGCVLPSPFWAFPWAGGVALARTILDEPVRVRGRLVLDLGCGGGVASFACASVGARVVANDFDPWALAVTRSAALRQQLRVETLLHDFARQPEGIEAYDVVLCSELAYDKTEAPQQRAALERAARSGATVLLADSGRTYFEDEGLEKIAQYELNVPRDLEGVDVRTAHVYLL